MFRSKQASTFLTAFIFSAVLAGCKGDEKLRPIAGIPKPNDTYFAELLQVLEEQIEVSPGDVDLRIKLAVYHQSLQWPSNSKGNLEAILQQAPRDTRAIMLAADYYIHNNDFEKSWIYAQQADKLGITHPSIYLIKSRYYYYKRDFNEASRLLNHYFTLGGKLSEAYLLGAEMELQQRDSAAAIKILKSGLQEGPGDVRLVSLLSGFYAVSGDYQSLAQTVEIYQAKTNDSATFRHPLLQAYFQTHSHQKGAALASQWPEESENGLFVYGNLFLDAKMLDSANWYATKILETDSASTDGFLLRARYEASRGRNSEAYRLYTSILELDSTHQIAHDERGMVMGKIAYLRKLREQQAAMPVFDIAPKKSENQ